MSKDSQNKFIYKMKEKLYCVPYDKKVALHKNGISYHCERYTHQ